MLFPKERGSTSVATAPFLPEKLLGGRFNDSEPSLRTESNDSPLSLAPDYYFIMKKIIVVA